MELDGREYPFGELEEVDCLLAFNVGRNRNAFKCCWDRPPRKRQAKSM